MSQEILDRSDVDLRQQSDDTSVETPDNGEIAAVSVAAVTYKGPLPPPAILQGYKEINPAYADMIMQDFVKNSEHYRNAEMAELEAQIKESRMGQRMAFLLSLALLCIRYPSGSGTLPLQGFQEELSSSCCSSDF